MLRPKTGGRLDVDSWGFGLGTVRGSRSGAGLIDGLGSGGRVDVDMDGFGVGTAGGARSGAFVGAVPPSIPGQQSSYAVGGVGGAPACLSAPAGRLDVNGNGFGVGTPRGTRSGAGLVLSQPQSIHKLNDEGRVTLAAPHGRLDMDADGYGLGTPRGSRSGAGLLLSYRTFGDPLESDSVEMRQASLGALGGGVDQVAPGGRVDVDDDGFGTGTPRGTRSGAGLVLLPTKQHQQQQQPSQVLVPDLDPGVLGLSAPNARLDAKAGGSALGTRRGFGYGAGVGLGVPGAGGVTLATAQPLGVGAPPLLGGVSLSLPQGRAGVDGEGYRYGMGNGGGSGTGLVLSQVGDGLGGYGYILVPAGGEAKIIGYAPVYAPP